MNTRNTQGFIPYTTVTYDTNSNGICGATAAAILTAYYYYHIDSSVVSSTYITYDGYALTQLLSGYIPANANLVQLVLGLGAYLSDRSCGRTSITGILNRFSIIYNCIDNDTPLIIGLTNEPTYGEHWAVGIGYNTILGYVYINDGWGHNDRFVSTTYIDCCDYIT